MPIIWFRISIVPTGTSLMVLKILTILCLINGSNFATSSIVLDNNVGFKIDNKEKYEPFL